MDTILLKVPVGTGSVKTADGTEYFANDDGYVEVPIDQVQALISSGFMQRTPGLQMQYSGSNLGDIYPLGLNFTGAGVVASRDDQSVIQVIISGGSPPVPFVAWYGGAPITLDGTETIPADWTDYSTVSSTEDVSSGHGAIELDAAGAYLIILMAQVVTPQPAGSTNWPDGLTVYGTKIDTFGQLPSGVGPSVAPLQSSHVFSLAAENAAVKSLSWTDSYIAKVDDALAPVTLNPGIYAKAIAHPTAVATARLSVTVQRLTLAA